jgi:hypothetical protein
MRILKLMMVVAGLALSGAAQAEPRLSLPLDCAFGRTCFVQSYVDHGSGPEVKDYSCGTRTYAQHNGTDFRILSMRAQREGVNVLAAAPGKVLRVRDGVADVSVNVIGKAAVSGKECGNAVLIDHGEGYEGQYCHMAQGSIAVKPGDVVARGAKLGKVGLSGQTEFPHLHFTLRRNGVVIDPFSVDLSGDRCGQTRTVWTPDTEKRLAYATRIILNRGFADHPVSMEDVENGAGDPPPGPDSPALVPFVRAIGLEVGDVQDMVLTGPDGSVLAQHSFAPLDRAKAQTISLIGRKRPAEGFAPGRYEAIYRITNGTTILREERFSLTF